MNTKKALRFLLDMSATAVVFLVLTYLSNTVLAAYDVTSVRPSAAMNPVLGIACGWAAILGCTIGNFISDLLSGYGIAVALLGFVPQIIYGALPYFVWRKLISSKSHVIRLDSPKITICFALLMAVNSIVIGIFVGGIQFFVSRSNFLNSALFVFQNNFYTCLIIGLPLMVFIDWIYSKFLHGGKKRSLSINEKIIAVSVCLQLVIFAFISISVLMKNRGEPNAQVWKIIFNYSGYSVNGILLVSFVVMYLFRYLKKKNEGLRIFERRHGTIFVDEKRRLEFVSYPSKPLESRTRPSYEKNWRAVLSSQKGCAMKCVFCDCPAYGFHGNASLEDFAYQIDTIVNKTGSSRTERFEVDFSRMGEPTANPEVLKFIEFHLRNQIEKKVDAEVVYPELSTMMPRTGNVENFLKEFCRIKNEVYDGNAALQISINTTDEALRRKMFRNLSLDLSEIAKIAATLPVPKGSKYALSFAVSKDSVIDASVIDKLFDKNKFLIKLTPVHQTFNAIDNDFEVTTECANTEIFGIFEKEFEKLGWDVMTFLGSREEDENELTSGNLLLSNIKEKLTSGARSTSKRKKRIGLIVAIEIDAIFEHYGKCKQLDCPPGFKLFLVERDNYDIYILQTGMGEIAASSGVQYLAAKFDVTSIVNFGVVGGLVENMKKQKLCLVEKVVHYKYDCSEFMDLKVGQVDGHDSIFLNTSESLVKLAHSVMEDLPLVTCCSGDKFISTADEKQYLHNTFSGDICDMESAGIVLACEANGIQIGRASCRERV